MNPLHISTSDKGGAGIACTRLHSTLLKNNIQSKLGLLYQSDSLLPESYLFSEICRKNPIVSKLSKKSLNILHELGINPTNLSKSKRFCNNRLKGLEMFSFPDSEFDITKTQLYKKSNIINLHWVSGFLDYTSFFTKNKKPVVWTMHDMNPFTGGEHYSEEFYGIDTNGYPIKRIVSNYEKKLWNKVLTKKSRLLKDIDWLHLVSPSEWLANKAKSSELFSPFPIKVIPNGIDFSLFTPRDKTLAREIFNLPQGKKIILFVSDNIANQRKGFEYLLKTIQSLKRTDLCFCAVGTQNNFKEMHPNLIFLGKITDERLMSIVYSACDAFIIPSLMDNLPNTVLESLACGTPVITFPTGGIVECVTNKENGLLCPEISVPALKNTLESFLNSAELYNREMISKKAQQKFDLSLQSEKYITLYKSLIV